MATIDDAVKQALKYLSTLEGIKDAPLYPKDTMTTPFLVGMSREGEWVFGASGVKKGLHTIEIQLHLERGDLGLAVEKSMRFMDTIPALLMSKLHNDNKWNGTVDAFSAIRYQLGPIGWNGTPTFGIRFYVLEVKIQNAIT